MRSTTSPRPSFVPMSWRQPVLTAEFAAVGCTALLEAIRRVDPEIRFYQASSSEIFGEPREVPQHEETPLSPVTPYGVAKAYAHFITRSYRRQLRAARVVRDPLQPRVSAPATRLRDAEGDARCGCDQPRARERGVARQPRGPPRLGLRRRLRQARCGSCSSSPSRTTTSSRRGTTHSVRELVECAFASRRPRLGGARSPRRVAGSWEGRAPRPRRGRVEGARAPRVDADARLRRSRAPSRRRRPRAPSIAARAGGRHRRLTVAVAGSTRRLLAPVGRPLRRAAVERAHARLEQRIRASSSDSTRRAGCSSTRRGSSSAPRSALGARLGPREWAGSVSGQSIFHLSQFDLLLDGDFERRGNRLGVSYFHGRPGTPGMPEFDACFATLRRRHADIDRVQVTNRAMEELVRGTGIAPEKVHRIPIGIDVDAFPLRTPTSHAGARRAFELPESAFVVGSFQKDGVGWGDGLEPKLIKGPDVLLDGAGAAPRARFPSWRSCSPGRARICRGRARAARHPVPARAARRHRLGRACVRGDRRLPRHVARRGRAASSARVDGDGRAARDDPCRAGRGSRRVTARTAGWSTSRTSTASSTRPSHVAEAPAEELERVRLAGRATAEENSYVALRPRWRALLEGFVELPGRRGVTAWI